MNREVINFTEDELEELICDEAPEGFKWKTKDIVYYDSEKSFIIYQVVIQRVSDNKFFAGRYSCWGSGNNEWEDDEFTKVFLKETIVITYE